MAVVNIPPDNTIYGLGQINGTMHVYNTNNPPGGNTTYDLTIVNVNHWANVVIQPGHTDPYPAGGNAVYIQNHGPSRLQVLYDDGDGEGSTPEEAGWETADEMPSA